MTEVWTLSATEIADLVRSRKLSALDVTEATLARCAAVNPAINAVVQDTSDEARATARDIDARIARGDDPGPLAGVPLTVKVNTDQAGYATTNGLKIQANLVAERDNPVVANLRRAGAVIVGRTNTPAFSLRWFCRNGIHGHTRNPHDPALTPGGSSGGAGAALATGIGAIAHGTDIGGSIRYPAYACGVHGLRPTLGRVPAFNFTGPDRLVGGQIMAVSGPLARTVADLKLALDAMSRPSLDDPWWVPVAPLADLAPKRAALAVAPDGMTVDPTVQAALRDAADKLRDAGWQVQEVEPPSLREPARLQAMMWLAEFRRTGGAALVKEADPDATFVFAEMEALCEEPDLDRFMDVLQARSTWVRTWQAFFDRHGPLLCPVSGELPFPDQLDVQSRESFRRVMEAQLTQVGLPLMGMPGLTVTTGRAEVGRIAGRRVPVGVQIIGGRYWDERLLAAGEEIARRSPTVEVVDPVTA